MTSERPEYNKKILLSVHLAPPVFMGHVENDLLQLNVRYLDSIEVSEITFCSFFCDIWYFISFHLLFLLNLILFSDDNRLGWFL